jgi:hypothetical protein
MEYMKETQKGALFIGLIVIRKGITKRDGYERMDEHINSPGKESISRLKEMRA